MNDTAATRLTPVDRWAVSEARELAPLDGAAIRAWAGTEDSAVAFAQALGKAQVLLKDLADIIGRLDGQPAAQAGEGARHG